VFWFVSRVKAVVESGNFTRCAVPLIESLKSKVHRIIDVRQRKNLTHLQSILLFKDSSGIANIAINSIPKLPFNVGSNDVEKCRDPPDLAPPLAHSQATFPLVLFPLPLKGATLLTAAGIVFAGREWRQFNYPPTPSENGRVLLALI
jgi:hypothetical protein